MLTAITRAPGPELARCELTYLKRQPIDPARAAAQHRAYQDALRTTGASVIDLPSDSALPDGVFVEDTAVVLDELAVIASPAPPSRHPETTAVAAALALFRPLVQVPGGAPLEGGDVFRLGKTLYVGLSARTGAASLQALEAFVWPLGYTVVPVPVRGCLHLKSACTALDEETLLVNRAWVDVHPLADLRLVDVPVEEPFAANVLRLPDQVCASAAYPWTAEAVRRLGYTVTELDVSELHKAEAGMTCMSLLFEQRPASL